MFWAVQLFVAGLLAVIARFFSRYEKQIDKAIDQHKKETDQLRSELHEMKAAMPQTYVFRDDYIRTMADFNRKLDRLLEHSGGGR